MRRHAFENQVRPCLPLAPKLSICRALSTIPKPGRGVRKDMLTDKL
jgi:hypothetical protein